MSEFVLKSCEGVECRSLCYKMFGYSERAEYYWFTCKLTSDSPILSSVLYRLRLTDCQHAAIVYYVGTRENGEDATAEHGAVSTLVEPPIDVSHEKTSEGIDADVNDDTGATVVNGIVSSPLSIQFTWPIALIARAAQTAHVFFHWPVPDKSLSEFKNIYIFWLFTL